MASPGIPCGILVSYGVLWNVSKSYGFLLNLMTSLIPYHPKLARKSYGIPWSQVEPYVICCNPLISYGMIYYPMESYGAPIQQYGILWAPMESQSTLHYSIVSHGILWHPMESHMKSYEYHGKSYGISNELLWKSMECLMEYPIEYHMGCPMEYPRTLLKNILWDPL